MIHIASPKTARSTSSASARAYFSAAGVPPPQKRAVLSLDHRKMRKKAPKSPSKGFSNWTGRPNLWLELAGGLQHIPIERTRSPHIPSVTLNAHEITDIAPNPSVHHPTRPLSHPDHDQNGTIERLQVSSSAYSGSLWSGQNLPRYLEDKPSRA